MNSTSGIPPRPAALVLVSLSLASAVSVSLVAVRFAASHQLVYVNLVWNLFLAWLPLAFAVLAVRSQASRQRLLCCAFLWLLFLPNSPYLVTDLVHLRLRPPVPLWFDVLLVQSFVLTGLLLGFHSLYLMHRWVSHSFGWRIGWLFTLVILGMTALGIYLGRFERWNSWDVFLSPIALSTDVLKLVIHPRANKIAAVFSLLCAGLLVSAYLAFYAVTTLHRSASSPNASNPTGTNDAAGEVA